MRKLGGQRGDTIVEVMIALAILGLAFALAYATANNALQVAQNSEEHSRALQLLDGQIELLRDYPNNTAFFDGHSFCVTDANINNPTSLVAGTCSVPLNSEINYTLTDRFLVPSPPAFDNKVFELTITWPGLGNLGPQKEQIFYRLYQHD